MKNLFLELNKVKWINMKPWFKIDLPFQIAISREIDDVLRDPQFMHELKEAKYDVYTDISGCEATMDMVLDANPYETLFRTITEEMGRIQNIAENCE
jgi:hypothetical protein